LEETSNQQNDLPKKKKKPNSKPPPGILSSKKETPRFELESVKVFAMNPNEPPTNVELKGQNEEH
jgi:hypothetical protein